MAKPLSKEIAFNGRLRTYEDPASIGPNDFVTLTNLRYTYTHPKSINGMSAITSTGVAQNIGNAAHFRKGQPSESHVLVHAVSAIYDMTAAIPATGVFGAALWTDTAAGATARFAYTNGLLAYANGVGDTCVFGGDEFRCGGFIVYTSAAKYDFTDVVNNVRTDAGNIATLTTYQASADANTMMLLHLDNNVTDSSPTTAHTVTNTNVTFSSIIKKMGTYSALFNTNAYLSAPDNSDFDFSGGTWTVDFWINAATITGTDVLFFQKTDANNYIKISAVGPGGSPYGIALSIYSASSEVVAMATNQYIMQTNSWHHVAVVENGSNYYIFIDGILSANVSDADRAANYTGTVCIGANDTPGDYFNGYLDEFRVSNSARWTSSFTTPSTAYGTDYVTNIYLGSLMPLSGIKLYVANSQSGKTISIVVNEWNGSGWSALTVTPTSQVLADSTAFSVTWASTASTSKMREVEKVVQYWYQIVLSHATDFNGVTISRCTTNVPFQQIKDIWDGQPWGLAAFLTNKSGGFQDNTPNVSDDTYDSANEGSYAKLVSLSNTDYMVIGSTEPLMGFFVQFAGSYVNGTDTTIGIAYYNGTDMPDNAGAWTTVTGLVDGTLNGTKCFNKSSFVTWAPPAAGNEFKSAGWSSIGRSAPFKRMGITVTKPEDTSTTKGDTYPLYYYKITFSGATTSLDVRISYAYGIPAQKVISGFKFPVVHQDRLWLCCDMEKDKNYVLCSSYQAPTVLGFGNDNDEFWLGDDTEIVAGASLFTRYGSTVADVLVLCKQHETYVIDGDGPDTYKQRRVSEHIGCIAPLTMVTVPMGDEAIPATPRNIAIWLSQQGVVAFDGNNFVVISKDIQDKFEPSNANYIGSAISTCTAFYDSTYGEYHLIVPGSAEYVYDVAMKKWYTIDRGSFDLRSGLTVYDTNGLPYTYGAAGTKLYRLENGTTMAGDAFISTIRNGDIAVPEGSVMEDSRVNWMMLVGKVGTNNVSASYYTDASTTAEASVVKPSTNAGKRLMNWVSHQKSSHGSFHGFELASIAPFEPMYLAFRYTIYPRELS